MVLLSRLFTTKTMYNFKLNALEETNENKNYSKKIKI